jgi:putative nucleotidyltransferase with HDIG domain
MMDRQEANTLLEKYITDEGLQHHSRMVAAAMEAYAQHLDKSEQEVQAWWLAGLLHDLDWEKYPEEHPHKAINEILPEYDLEESIIHAIRAHAPERTGFEPETEIERYLFACDELSGFMNAVSLVRPNKFSDMKVKSVRKKLKDQRFAANVPRDDIQTGAELIDQPLADHIQFLIEVFKERP